MLTGKLKFFFLALVVAAAVQLYLKSAAARGNLGYVGSWSTAVEEAKSSGKPILLNFGGSW
jgi:hypothetical protein